MPKRPIDENTARSIIEISVAHFGLRAGQVLPLHRLMEEFYRLGLNGADIAAGLAYAVSNGWLSSSDDSGANSLTEAGLHQAQR
jgi:hypothetical protein